LCFLVSDCFGGVLEMFDYFPVTAILAYSFLVSHRLRLLETKELIGNTQSVFVGPGRYTAQLQNAFPHT
jgi:hypothetical protein